MKLRYYKLRVSRRAASGPRFKHKARAGMPIRRSAPDLLAFDPAHAGITFEPPRADIRLRPTDFRSRWGIAATQRIHYNRGAGAGKSWLVPARSGRHLLQGEDSVPSPALSCALPRGATSCLAALADLALWLRSLGTQLLHQLARLVQRLAWCTPGFLRGYCPAVAATAPREQPASGLNRFRA